VYYKEQLVAPCMYIWLETQTLFSNIL